MKCQCNRIVCPHNWRIAGVLVLLWLMASGCGSGPSFRTLSESAEVDRLQQRERQMDFQNDGRTAK